VSLEDKRIGFIGGGAMAEALIGGLRGAGVDRERILASEPEPGRRKHLEERHGIRTGSDNAEVARAADLVVLAVKPSVVPAVLEGLRAEADLDSGRPLWISIAAGVTLATLGSGLGPRARIVRAMPNTPALIGAGATALCGNPRTSAADRGAARALFDGVGITWEAPREDLLDAVTGLSGSGPAYVFVFLEALGDAGVRMGLPRDAARLLALETVYGAARLARETGRDPADLRRQVTSPGGTTLAGLERLEAGGLRAAIHEAVAAATRRSRELGGGAAPSRRRKSPRSEP
jgi:pyrroline-5-carboxylate reductase